MMRFLFKLFCLLYCLFGPNTVKNNLGTSFLLNYQLTCIPLLFLRSSYGYLKFFSWSDDDQCITTNSLDTYFVTIHYMLIFKSLSKYYPLPVDQKNYE